MDATTGATPLAIIKEGIDAGIPVSELMSEIKTAFPSEQDVKMTCQAPALHLHIDTIIPIALIINELIYCFQV